LSNDLSQLNLTEPAQVDWANYGKSNYQAPPAAIGPDGKFITYTGIAKTAEVETEYVDKDDDGNQYLTIKLDPVVIPEANNYEIRFASISVKPYTQVGSDGKRVAKKGNPNRAADFLRAAGSQAKPQLNSEYLATAKAVVAQGKKFTFNIDWEAKNKETGEKIRGYNAFPQDPVTGQRKAVLKAGDFYNVLDSKGQPTGEQKQVQSEVLFANAKLRYFVDATPKVVK
jgi:hypothetical protein